MASYTYVANFLDPSGTEVLIRFVEGDERTALIRTEKVMRELRGRGELFKLNISINDRASERRVQDYLGWLVVELEADDKAKDVRPHLKLAPGMERWLPPLVETRPR